MPIEDKRSQAVRGSSTIKGNHVSSDLLSSRKAHTAAHASIDLQKQGNSDKGKKTPFSLKKKLQFPALPFGKKDKGFAIPAGEDLTTDSTRLFKDFPEEPYENGSGSRKKPMNSAKNPFKRFLKRQQSGVPQKAAPNKPSSKEVLSEKNEANKSKIKSLIENRSVKASDKKRAKNKVKADRQFDKIYGSSSMAVETEKGAPRAALYSTKMGTAHKKSSKMQIKDVRDVASQSLGFIGDVVVSLKLPHIPKFVTRILTMAAIIAIFGFGLYAPAQQYYVQMRETDRLQAEYVEVATRTNNLAESIDALHTKEGIEDKAHSDLGYVKSGEQSATVKGIAQINLQHLPTSNVAPGSIPAPDTWYSGVLDVLFGYKGYSS